MKQPTSPNEKGFLTGKRSDQSWQEFKAATIAALEKRGFFEESDKKKATASKPAPEEE